MSKRWGKVVLSCLAVLVVLGTLLVGCGKEEGEGKIVITIGHVSDMTGPASTALVPINYAARDLAKYYNDNNLIPGVELKVVEYDARYDPSRDIPGWEWVKSKGAILGLTALPTTAETLKAPAERDKMPLWALSYSEVLDYPPGWVFLINVPNRALINPLLKWISENDWDYNTKGIPKVGSAGWEEPYAIGCKNAVRDYVLAHPDKFQYVGGYLVPAGGMTWGGEALALKSCDYLWPPSTGTGITTFMNEFRDKGGKAKFVGTDSHAAYKGLIVDSVGWDRVDGMLATSPTRWWTETSSIVDLAKQLLQQNHAADYDETIYAGIGYVGGFHQIYAFFQVIKKAIEDVGAENFNGQAFYNTAISFSTQWPGYEPWGFTATKRYAWSAVGLYKWSKADQNIVRLVDPWLSIDVT